MLELANIELRQVAGSDAEVLCRSILTNLPDWFGIPEAIDEYCLIAQTEHTVGLFVGDRPVGVMVLKTHSRWNAEIVVMGVEQEAHGQGLGRKLIVAAESYAKTKGSELLTVKTVSEGNSDPFYARTRAFYRAIGFEDFEELPELWDEFNPCLILVKRV